jgi:hypothetical protein
MTTKKRFRNKYRLEIREDDHPPMHAHLAGGAVDVVISLDPVRVTQGEAPAALMREVLVWVEAHKDSLIKEWNLWHS